MRRRDASHLLKKQRSALCGQPIELHTCIPGRHLSTARTNAASSDVIPRSSGPSRCCWDTPFRIPTVARTVMKVSSIRFEASTALVFYAMTPRKLFVGYQPPKRRFPSIRLHGVTVWKTTMSVFSPATARSNYSVQQLAQGQARSVPPRNDRARARALHSGFRDHDWTGCYVSVH
jgi:hypothetical protein